MPKSVLCKFFAHGACLKGEHCEFSHDWKDPPNMVCTFYSKGACSFGSRCRYDHVKNSVSHTPASSNVHQSLAPDLFSPSHSPGTVSSMLSPAGIDSMGPLDSSTNLDFSRMRAWWDNSRNLDLFDNSGPDLVSSNSAERPICSFAAVGFCPRGEKCPHIHGQLCSSCGKYCLHPLRPEEREMHIKACEKKQSHLETLKKSQEVECSVCLERVLSKKTAAERKFGLLSECDHPFCISCIRNWRSTSPASGMDVNSSLRTCPICRKLSYFVIPSVIWYATKEEKQNIVDSYKSKLRSIDCKYFDFGNGSCPFGSSCFYKHAYRDGRVEEIVLRHLGDEDGRTVIAKNIRLSDFLSSLHIG